ncbi:MAG: hypothetical protein PVI77_07070 [Desulfobacterales bacterium]
MVKRVIWGMIILLLVIAGCAAQKVYTSSPAIQTVSTSHYKVTLEPLRAKGYSYYNRFRYQFTNQTNGDLVIDWSQTYYLRNGKRHGHFGWEGLTFEQLREAKEEPKITIAAGKKDAIEIFPVKLIGWKEEGVRMKATTPEAGFTLTPLPDGENGMSIAVLKDGEVLRKNILVNITLD